MSLVLSQDGGEQVNGQESVYIDRGRWLYRFSLDSGVIAISRLRRSGQYLVSPEVWRCVAELGVSDVLIVPVPGGWQAFVELAEGRHRWALARRPTLDESEQGARHLLGTMADAIAGHAKLRPDRAGTPANNTIRLPGLPAEPAEDAVVEAALAQARAERQAEGWELVYNRERAHRA